MEDLSIAWANYCEVQNYSLTLQLPEVINMKLLPVMFIH